MGLGSIEVAGAEIAARSSGEGAGVLFVHGPGLASWVFEATLLALGPQEEIKAVTYDRRGYGASTTDAPLRGTTVAEQAEDAVAVIEALELAPALVVGFEVGALVALDLLLRHRPLLSGARAGRAGAPVPGAGGSRGGRGDPRRARGRGARTARPARWTPTWSTWAGRTP